MTEDEAAAITAKYPRYFGDADAAVPSTIAAVVGAEAPNLTQMQHATLAAAVRQVASDGWTTGMLRRQIDICVTANPGLIAPIPSARELFVALGGDEKEPQVRIEMWRKLQDLDEQARLDMMPAPVKEAEPEKKPDVEKPTPAAELTDDQADDLIAERLGFPTRQAMRAATMAVKLRGYRDAVRKDAAKPAARAAPSFGTPATVGDLDVKSEAFKKLSPQQRLTRFRAAFGR